MNGRKNLHRRGLLVATGWLFIFLVIVAQPAFAQGPVTVTDDDVNRIAHQLYCPVCENIPLDVCGTQACAQWRDEIRIQLQAGKTEQQIIADFVNRYGDRVVGTPQDPTLRNLSLVTPWVLSAIALLIAAAVFVRWRLAQTRSLQARAAPAALATPVSNAELTPQHLEQYRARLERDLARRR